MATVDYALTTAETEAPKLQTKADFALDFAKRLEIQTMGEYETVAGNVQEIAGALAETDKLRTNITKPLMYAKKQTDAFFAPVLDKLKAAEKIVRGKLAHYAEGKTAARDAAFAAGDFEEAEALELPTVKGCSVTVGWDVEVTDVEALPREYLVPDLKKLAKLADAQAGQLEIPGVKAVPKAKLRVAKR